jgi:hypothetical protein
MALTKASLIDLNSNELVLDLDADTSITADTDDTIHFKIAGSDEITMTAGAIAPSTSDGNALGTTSLMFSDLFLASGSVVNFNNGDVTLTHASNTLVLAGGSLDINGQELILDADADTSITASTDDQIDFRIGGSDLITFTAGKIDLKNAGTASQILFYCESNNAHAQTVIGAPHSEGANNVLTLPGTGGDARLVSTTSTATLTNKTLTTPIIAEIDSGSTITLDATTDIVLDADGGDIFFKDGGTTFGSATNTSGNLIIKSGTTTALTFSGANVTAAGTITGNLTGNVTGNTSGTALTVTQAAQTAITSLGTLTTLTVDNIITNGTTIGHTDDTDLITLADGIVTVAGEVQMTTLDIGGTNVTATAAELNLLDGGTSVGSSITLADADGFVVNDGGAMKTIPASDIKTYNPGGTAWQSVVTGTTTMVSGRGYFVNTTSSAFTMTLPSSASIGDNIQIIDYAGTADTNNITIGRNSHNIQGEAADLVVTTERAAFTLVYVDSTQGWLLDSK